MKTGAVVGIVAGVVLVGAGIAWAASRDKAGPGQFDVTGSSGTKYRVKHVKTFATEGGKQSFWDLFVGDSRIVRYAQLDNDKDSRVFIVSPLASNDPRLDVALRDFGIRFEGGPTVQLVSGAPAPQLQQGQIVVSPGAWMATAKVSFPKSMLVTASLIKSALEEQGWRQVSVLTAAPADWPISKDGDYFIDAVWFASPRIFVVPKEVVDLKSRALA